MMRTGAALAAVLPALLAAQDPLTIGHVHTLHSHVLGEERTINIALPQDYHPDSAARYPVAYLLDGGADEDLIHVVGALQFAAFPWIAWQRPGIVVGIANTDRRRDLTFPTTIAADKEKFPTTGGSAAFMRYIADEVIPFVEANYRTMPDDRMLIGQSLGGLFAAEVLLKRPDLFTRYLIVSPSIWWDGGSLLRTSPAFADAAMAPAKVFIAVGKEGKPASSAGRRMQGDAKRLYKLVRKNPRIRAGFAYLPQHDHANILHQAVMDGLRWMGE
jgi:predicted alpha/beta superfamily hydrolase